ncbi:hypothetical protein B0H13DRAFT_1867204 [Mycena leptocephala]|nr:hypothetical protein B0H13DRAFT_1867204 [Mycena leptocephala]
MTSTTAATHDSAGAPQETKDIVPLLLSSSNNDDNGKSINTTMHIHRDLNKGKMEVENDKKAKNSASLQLPGDDTPMEATDCFNMAHHFLVELKAAANISSLNTVQDRHADVNNRDMMITAVNMFKEVFHAHDQATLENAIFLYHEALELAPKSYFQQWRILRELAEALLIHFHLTGNLTQLNEAVSCLREVQQAKPTQSICLSAALMMSHEGPLGLLHYMEGISVQQEHHDMINLEAAVRTLQEAESLLSWGHEARGRLLNNLGVAAQAQFEQQEDPNDLDEAIRFYREALEIHAAPHPNRSMSLYNLGAAVKTRFKQQLDPNDLHEAIQLHREALEIHAAPHPTDAFITQFEQQGDPNDLDEAIVLHREALEIRASPHPDRCRSLYNLANAVTTQFEQRGDPNDLDEAIVLYREALEICAAPHPLRSSSLNGLARAVIRRFEQRGDPNDLDEAIGLHREAFEIRAVPHPDQSMSLNNLAIGLVIRFQQRGILMRLFDCTEKHWRSVWHPS